MIGLGPTLELAFEKSQKTSIFELKDWKVPNFAIQSVRISMQLTERGCVVIDVNEEVLAHKLVVQGESNQELFLGLEFGIEGIRFGVP